MRRLIVPSGLVCQFANSRSGASFGSVTSRLRMITTARRRSLGPATPQAQGYQPYQGYRASARPPASRLPWLRDASSVGGFPPVASSASSFRPSVNAERLGTPRNADHHAPRRGRSAESRAPATPASTGARAAPRGRRRARSAAADSFPRCTRRSAGSGRRASLAVVLVAEVAGENLRDRGGGADDRILEGAGLLEDQPARRVWVGQDDRRAEGTRADRLHAASDTIRPGADRQQFPLLIEQLAQVNTGLERDQSQGLVAAHREALPPGRAQGREGVAHLLISQQPPGARGGDGGARHFRVRREIRTRAVAAVAVVFVHEGFLFGGQARRRRRARSSARTTFWA